MNEERENRDLQTMSFWVVTILWMFAIWTAVLGGYWLLTVIL